MLDGEADDVATIWHASGRAAYGFIERWQRFTLDEARAAFRERIAQLQIWVAEIDGGIAGFVALSGERDLAYLYIAPDAQRRGVGTALMNHAKQLRPDELELYTHQRNEPARAFYEQHGFVAIAYGVSPAPENEPDVRYRWAPMLRSDHDGRIS